MGREKNLIKELKIFKKELSKQIPVQRMILFGSQATGKTHKWSDIDLVIISNRFKRKKSYTRARGFYDLWKLQKPADFLCYTPEEFQCLSKEFSFGRQIVREGIDIK